MVRPRPTTSHKIEDMTDEEIAVHEKLDAKGYMLRFMDTGLSRHKNLAAYRIIQRNTAASPEGVPGTMSFEEVEHWAETLPTVRSKPQPT